METHIDPIGPIGPVVNCTTTSTETPTPPGFLTITLHEGVGFSAADHYKERPIDEEHTHNRSLRRPPCCRRCNLPYAVVDYEKCQVTLDSLMGTTESPAWVVNSYTTCKIYVSRFAELSIYFYIREPNNVSRESQGSMFLGVARVNPFDALGNLESQWLELEDGTGKIRVSFDYMNSRTLETADFKRVASMKKGGCGSGYFLTNPYSRAFAKKKIRKPTAEQLVPQPGTKAAHTLRSQIINHPFIAPLALAFQSDEGLHLISPFVSGGHLFHHVQREKCFDVDRSQLYAAEILSALEYLHDAHSIFSWLKPGNVLLDSLGHVVLCGFGLFNSENIHGTAEYPAPELLRDESGYRMAADWWTLGVFLYEMLTGLPPFYDDDSDDVRRKILDDQPIWFPESLPLDAKDIITKLLDRRPEQRLGANEGAPEIKAHPFFYGVDWHKLLQRKYEPTLKPNDVSGHFKQHGVLKDLPRPTMQEMFAGWSYSQSVVSEIESNIGTNTSARAALTSKTSQATVNDLEDSGWGLAWEKAIQEFHFYSHSTGTKLYVPPRVVGPMEPGDNNTTSVDPSVPSQSQKQDVLEAALKAGNDHIVSQLILEYGGMDLNIEIFHTQRTTPLKWAAEHENIRLVKLFLDRCGANANVSNFDSHHLRPALIKAVEKGNREIAELLVRKTDRVASTRALGLAVDRGDIEMAKLLLANGVRCDFEESDRPLPQHPLDNGCYFPVSLEPEEFVDPLVRAVRRGNVDLVRLFLARGVDVNAGYHDYHDGHNYDLILDLEQEHIHFSCGRPVQMAMELRHHEIAQLLLAAGADVCLAAPIWSVPGHDCRMVSRAVYQRVTAGLRTAAASKKCREAAARNSI